MRPAQDAVGEGEGHRLHLEQRLLEQARLHLGRKEAPSNAVLAHRAPAAVAWSRLVGGSAAIGAGVALLVRARLGLDGYSCLCAALAQHLHVAVGTASALLGAGLLVGAALGMRKVPHIGAAVEFLVVGQSINLALELLPQPAGPFLRIMTALAGLAALGVGVGVYLASDLCLAPFEAVATWLAQCARRSFGLIYNLLEGICLLAGVLLGGRIGVMTAAVALVCGPLAVRVRHRLTPVSPAPVPSGTLVASVDPP